MNRTWIIVALLGLTGACAAGGSTATTEGQGGAGAAGATTGAGTTTSTGTGASAPAIPFCFTPCSSTADCAFGAGTAYDASHWSCTQGVCAYLGCTSEAECMKYAPGYHCVIGQDQEVPYCQPGCASPADCASPNGNPLFDADHYACTNGTCYMLGCQADSDCNWQQPAGTSACRKQPRYSYPWCVKACSSVADCVDPKLGPAQDADNYACNAGICEYTGCHSDQECQASFPTEADIVCFTPP